MRAQVKMALDKGLCKPHDHIVVVQRIHGDFCVKVISVDSLGSGIATSNMVQSSSFTHLTDLTRVPTVHPA